ncbi:MAG TPA: zinc-dependent alcohol dehydrogenase family protein [Candidatus Binatia bacterium]|nr:zinc-dependent alcohol dehydrogenase family protein [Candidatus Binatia bacterium]
MKAMVVEHPGPIEKNPLALVELPVPEPAVGEILVRVEVCAVCRTDLHVAEGDLPPHKSPVAPGHEAVGTVVKLGPGTGQRLQEGDRVGVAWLHASCRLCPYCVRGEENLCTAPRFTGYDVNGGYAEYLVAPEDFVYLLPPDGDAVAVAPLLCAGIIGYRALRRSGVRRGERLGLYGFGASAHIVIQIARYWGCEVYVVTRGDKHQALASRMGAVWVGDAAATPPEKLHAAIIFAPAGELVPRALAVLDRGGTLALAGVYMTPIPTLDYEATLFYERNLRSVTANTRQDGIELLQLAKEIPLHTHTEEFSLAQANAALAKLKHDQINGAAVLRVSG